MKRSFLTSFGLSAFPDFVGKDPKNVRIGFISTAADLHKNPWYVEKDRKFLLDQGYDLIEVDIKDKLQLEKLNNVDVIYVTGGNTFYLLEKAIESGALGLIKDLANNGII